MSIFTKVTKILNYGYPNGNFPKPDEKIVRQIRHNIQEPKERNIPNIPLEEIKFVVMDSETTGLNPYKGDEIISLGAVVLENGTIKLHPYFYRVVNPCRDIPTTAARITGISTKTVQNKETIWEVLPEFFDLADKSVLAGHHINFDLTFLNLKLKHFCKLKICHPSIDTFRLAQVLHPQETNHTLDHLLKLYDLPPEGRHTALGDALLTAKLLQFFLSRLREQFNIYYLRDLMLIQQQVHFYRAALNHSL